MVISLSRKWWMFSYIIDQKFLQFWDYIIFYFNVSVYREPTFLISSLWWVEGAMSGCVRRRWSPEWMHILMKIQIPQSHGNLWSLPQIRLQELIRPSFCPCVNVSRVWKTWQFYNWQRQADSTFWLLFTTMLKVWLHQYFSWALISLTWCTCLDRMAIPRSWYDQLISHACSLCT